MSEKEYIVSLNRGVDYAAFNQEMIASTGAGQIPSRSVEVANERPGSKRNTHYNLTDAEVETLKNDPRVAGVTLLPDLDPSIGIGFDTVQAGDFTKTTLDRGAFLNWGMRRINESTNPYSGVNVSGGYNYTLDGTGVDVVIMDSGIQADHPEFQDANGVSRVQEIDWTTESGISNMPDQAANYYTDTDGHGTHVAGTAVGKTYGWAKNARIYSVKLSGLEGPGDTSGTSATYAFDCIKEWHNNKPIDPATGVKRPTVVNMSWGYLRRYDTVINLTYRGDLKTGTDIDSAAKRWAFGLVPVSGGSGYNYAMNVRNTSADTDLQEMIDAGIHVTIAAGNRSHKIDIEGGEDFGNFVAADTGSNEYHKGSSPFDTEAHIVGNIDSTIHIDGLEQKAASSECGPGVSIYAPGTDIMSAMSTTNTFGADISNNPYPEDSSFLINNISGTSMAAPQVAGVLALWLQINPSATPAQGLTFLNSSAKTDQIYETGSSVDYTDTRSLLGSANRFTFNKFNKSTQLTIGNSDTQQVSQTPTYALSSSAASVNEGSSFTITLTTTNIDDGTVIPYTISGVTSADINGTNLSGNFVVTNNTSQITVVTSADATTEGAETFVLSLNSLSTSQSVTINDTSQTPAQEASYAVAAAANNVDEDSSLTFNVTTTLIEDGTTLYWTVTNDSDFATSSGSFTITSNAGSFSVTPTADATTEGAETFTASIRTDSVSGTVVATSSSVTINDTSTTPAFSPDYTITVTNNGASAYTLSGTDRNGAVSGDNPTLAFNSGDKVRFSVNASGHPFYVKTAQVTGTGDQASGVDNNGAEVGDVDWTVGSTGTFYYQCSIHSVMNAAITAS